MKIPAGRQSIHGASRGAALVEFAIVVPLLIVFFLGVVDLGRALNTYMKLAQITGEGIRLAASRSLLEEGSFRNLSDTGAVCESGSTGNPWEECPGQWSLHSRIGRLLSLYGLDESGPEVVSVYEHTLQPDNPTVSVSITASYNGLLPLFRSLPLRTQKTGSYLF